MIWSSFSVQKHAHKKVTHHDVLIKGVVPNFRAQHPLTENPGYAPDSHFSSALLNETYREKIQDELSKVCEEII